MNQIGVSLRENLKDINWEFVYNHKKLTVHGIPVILNTISYGLMLKTYMRYIHNRPYATGLSPQLLENRRLIRNRQLAAFCIIGAPLTANFLRLSAIPMKDMFYISIGGGSQVENTNSNFISSNSSLFLILSNLNKKVPNWVKILFRLLILTLFLLKFWGFSLSPLFLLI